MLIIDVVTETFNQELEQTARSVVKDFPSIALGIIVILLGLFIGNKLRDVTEEVASAVVDSEIGHIFNGRKDGVVKYTGLIAKYYVVFFASFIAVKMVGIVELIQWFETLVVYFPRMFLGAVIITLGIGAGQYASQRVVNGDLSKSTGYEEWIAMIVKSVVYTVSVVIGLDLVGADMTFVYTVSSGFSGAIGIGLTAAIAIIIGLIVGIYVQENEVLDKS